MELTLPRLAFWNPEFVPVRFPKLLVSRVAGIPALGRMLPAPPAAKEPLARPPAGTAPTRLCCIDCRKLEVSCWNDAGRSVLLPLEPKNRCAPPLRMVEAAAGRPLADKLARDGTTGRFPAIMRAPDNCSRVAAIAPTRPAPKRPALTADMAPPM